MAQSPVVANQTQLSLPLEVNQRAFYMTAFCLKDRQGAYFREVTDDDLSEWTTDPQQAYWFVTYERAAGACILWNKLKHTQLEVRPVDTELRNHGSV